MALTRKNPLAFIILFVVSLHLFLLLFIYYKSSSKAFTPRSAKLAVKRIALSPKTKEEAPAAEPAKEIALPKEIAATQIEPIKEEASPQNEPVAKEISIPPVEPALKEAIPPPAVTAQEIPPPAIPKIKQENPKPKEEPKKILEKKAAAKALPVQPKITPKPKPKPKPKPAPAPSVSKPMAKDPPKQKTVSAAAVKEIPKGPSPEELAKQKRQRELLAKVQENIGKIEASSAKLPKESSISLLPTPEHINSLQSEALVVASGESFNEKERSYRDELASRLKLLLRLPEYGEVNLHLTLDRSGGVAKVEILSSENSANSGYVEKTIHKLKMPPFGDCFGNVQNYTFTITIKGNP